MCKMYTLSVTLEQPVSRRWWEVFWTPQTRHLCIDVRVELTDEQRDFIQENPGLIQALMSHGYRVVEGAFYTEQESTK